MSYKRRVFGNSYYLFYCWFWFWFSVVGFSLVVIVVLVLFVLVLKVNPFSLILSPVWLDILWENCCLWVLFWLKFKVVVLFPTWKRIGKANNTKRSPECKQENYSYKSGSYSSYKSLCPDASLLFSSCTS